MRLVITGEIFVELLKLKKEHIENLIQLAMGIKTIGVRDLTFDVFDKKK